MTSKKKITIPVAGAVLLALALLATAACEDTAVVAPEGSTITLVAQPKSVFIDQEAGQTSGTTTLVALVLSSGNPVQDIPVFFLTDGGLVGSVDNVCNGGSCSRSSTFCTDNTDCPFVPPLPIETDSDGIAIDTLTVRLIEDPDTVHVTAQISNTSATFDVTKNINLGPTDTVPIIDADPADGQRTGLPVVFSAAGSTFDPQVEIECYEWKIESNVVASNETIRSPDQVTLVRTYGTIGQTGQEQDLAITLRISDDPAASQWCTAGGTPPSGVFGPNVDTMNYQIRCDLTDPFVQAPSNQTRSLTVENPAQVTLTAAASDPEDFNGLVYDWDCGNGTGGSTQSVTCQYTTPGNYTATVTVTNDCGRTAQDSLTVTINL